MSRERRSIVQKSWKPYSHYKSKRKITAIHQMKLSIKLGILRGLNEEL